MKITLIYNKERKRIENSLRAFICELHPSSDSVYADNCEARAMEMTEAWNALNLDDDNKQQTFPNGFISWMETFFEVSAEITNIANKDSINRVKEAYEQGGRCSLYTLAKEITDKFELNNKGRSWDGEFFDEVDSFIHAEI